MSTDAADQVHPSDSGPSTGSWASHKNGDAEGSFPEMDVDADLERVSVIESLCMDCQVQGLTRLLLTRIPYFRDIVIMSFQCTHCNARHAEVQPANELAPKAARLSLVVNCADAQATKVDLNRQVIKSETCRVLIPEADFEIPATSSRGEITTVEGVLSHVAESLQAGQVDRERADPELAAKLQAVIAQFRSFASGEQSFTLILDDPAGNSFLENPSAPLADPRVTTELYERTREQTLELGYAVEENKTELEATPLIKGSEAASKLRQLAQEQKEEEQAGASSASALSSSSSTFAAAAARSASSSEGSRGVAVSSASMKSLDTYFNVSDRAATMLGPCTSCASEHCETRMVVTEVPHFRDVVLLVTQCDSCGYRDAEVKAMGQLSSHGLRQTLRVTRPQDLQRDLLKSLTARISIPELELEMMPGTLGAKYTTLEGILNDMRAQLEQSNPFLLGDSTDPAKKQAMQLFLARLAALPEVRQPWTFVLDDPLGASFIHSSLGDADPNLLTERYERTHAQNESLGLNDLDVDEYLTQEQRRELKQEMDREAAENEEREKARADEGDRSAPAAASVSPTKAHSAKLPAELEAQRRATKMTELKSSKLGGLIPVDRGADD